MNVLIVCETIEERKGIIEKLETYNFTLPYFSEISKASEKIPANSKMYFIIQNCVSLHAANGKNGAVYSLKPFLKNCILVREVELQEEMGKDISGCIIVKANIFLNEESDFVHIHPNYIFDLKAKYLTTTE